MSIHDTCDHDAMVYMCLFLERRELHSCMLACKELLLIVEEIVTPTQEDLMWCCKYNKTESLKRVLELSPSKTLNIRPAIEIAFLRHNVDCLDILGESNGHGRLTTLQRFGIRRLTNKRALKFIESHNEARNIKAHTSKVRNTISRTSTAYRIEARNANLSGIETMRAIVGCGWNLIVLRLCGVYRSRTNVKLS